MDAIAANMRNLQHPKSLSVASALTDGGTQAIICAAHGWVLAQVLGCFERRVLTSQSGNNLPFSRRPEE